ncbi:MAG: ABC transporter permease [Lachnospiraceae bacterium]|nr:ABC transporter permease [Lachnospiraceae bacterium]
MGNWCREVKMAMTQSLRLLLHGRQTMILLALGMAVLVSMLVCMDGAKEEKSRIPVGIVDEDRSDMSQAVVEAMERLELYHVTRGDKKELTDALKRGELMAVCLLKEGFAEAVAQGETDRIVTLYETTGSAMLMGDILAGAMMQEICTAKSYGILQKYEKKTERESGMTLEEYRAYVERFLAEEGDRFSFEVTYVASDVDREPVKEPAQESIYIQAIFAVFALMAGLMAVYAVLPFRNLRYGRLAEKVRTLPVRQSALYVGSALGALAVPVFFGTVFLGCFAVRNALEVSTFVSLLICTMGYSCVIVCIMLAAAYGIRSLTVYQMGMLVLVLVSGICGLVSLVDGLLLPEGTVGWVPNGWYVRKIMEILGTR